MAESPALPPLLGDSLLAPRDVRRVERTIAALFASVGHSLGGNPHLAPLIDRLAGFALRGGKRVRPGLCLASYRIAGAGPETPPAIWLVASSLELFHAFMLVHDDLIDGSVARRDEPTLHERFRRDAGTVGPLARKQGADLALVGGDILFALGLRLLSRARLEPAIQARVQRLVADMLVETGFGQSLDVLFDDRPIAEISEAAILEAYALKTSRYSIAGPLVLGATMAGAAVGVTRALGRFGDLLGMAYQIQNDLDGLGGPADNGDCADLDGGKRTLVLRTTHRRLNEPGRAALDEALAAPVGPERRRRLLAMIRGSGAIEECRDRIDRLAAEATAALAASPLDAIQRGQYLQLMGHFGPRGKAAGHVSRA